MNGQSGSAAPVLRTCIACRNVQSREKLLRIFLREGRVSLDPNNRAEGRGAYICKTFECLTSIRTQRKAFSRAFKKSLAEQGFENFFIEISEILQGLKGNEVVIGDNKSILNDKRNN